MKSGVIVRIGPRAIVATARYGNGKPPWTAEASRVEGEPIDVALDRLLGEVPDRDRGTLTLEVEQPLAQVRRLDSLPPVRGGALSTLVGHQAGTFFRKNGHPLVTDATWLPTVKDSPREALLAAIDLELAELLTAAAARAGMDIDRITVADLPDARRFDLRSVEAKAEANGRKRRSLWRLASGVGALWAFAAMCWAVRIGVEARSIRKELDRLAGARIALMNGRAVRHRAEEMIQTLTVASAVRHGLQDRTMALLKALPDSAYLWSVSLDTLGNGLLTGGSRRATEVVAALERSHAAINPRQEGPTSPDPLGGTSWERFTIRLGPSSR